MKILLITHFFPPTHNAGTENYTLGLATALQQRGHEVQVLCAEDWQVGVTYWNGVTEDTVAGVMVRRIHLNWMKARNPNRILYDSERVEAWLKKLLAEMKPDVVHVTSTYSLGVGVLRAVGETGIPLVLTLMDFWFLCPRTVLMTGKNELCDGNISAWQCQQCTLAGSRLHNILHHMLPPQLEERSWDFASHTSLLARIRGVRGLALDTKERKAQMASTLDIPDIILSHSKFVQQMFWQANLGHRIQYLPNGHDLTWAEHYQGKTASNVLRIGFIGQIVISKGVHVLVDAFRRANLAGHASLHIWGDLLQAPDYVQLLQTMIDGDETISLRGRFERFQLPLVFSEIDVLVVPSIWYENAPLAIQEAFATQTPVVATNLGGMAEAVTHDVSGLLFERGDAADLAQKIQRLIDEPTLLARLRQGVPIVKTVNEEVDQLGEIYCELVAERRIAVEPSTS